MSLLMIFRVALRAIWRNKVRSLLTALGIIVGIAAVIAVIAIGTGAGEQMKSSINSMGNNLVMIFPNFMRSSGVSLGAGAANTLTAADGEQIEKDFPNFHFHLALDRPDPAADAAGVKYTAGFVHNVMYETYLKDHDAPEDIKYFMCGPPMMVASVNKLLDSLGVQPESILYDNFS